MSDTLLNMIYIGAFYLLIFIGTIALASTIYALDKGKLKKQLEE